MNNHNLSDALNNIKGLILLNLKYLSGIILLGIPGLLLSDKYKFLLYDHPTFRNENLLTIWIVLLFSVVLISSLSVKKLLFQGGTISNSLSFIQRITYLSIRILFLLAYEFYFRGVLLFGLIPLLGLFSAITVNTFLYALQHLFDSKKEFIGCIPFGIILCLLSYNTLSIWPAFILHATLAVIYEGSLLFNNSFKTNLS